MMLHLCHSDDLHAHCKDAAIKANGAILICIVFLDNIQGFLYTVSTGMSHNGDNCHGLK